MAYTDQREEPEVKLEEPEEEKKTTSSSSGLSYLTSAFSRIGLSGLAPQEEKSAVQEVAVEPEKETVETEDFFSSAISKVIFLYPGNF